MGVNMRKFISSCISVLLLASVCIGITSSEYQEVYVNTFTPEVLTADETLGEFFRQEEAIVVETVSEPVVEEKVYDGVVYLTFDDGPVQGITPQILDILKEYDVKATFFMLGSYVKKNPEIAKRAYDEGHTLASHSHTHQKSMFNSLANFKNEIDKSTAALEEITGEKTKFFRIPYGTKIGQAYKDYLAEKGLSIVKWNCESYDSRVNTKTPEQILEGVKKTKPSKGDVIVIMHDTYGKQKTVDALASVIEYFQSINYEFKRFE